MCPLRFFKCPVNFQRQNEVLTLAVRMFLNVRKTKRRIHVKRESGLRSIARRYEVRAGGSSSQIVSLLQRCPEKTRRPKIQNSARFFTITIGQNLYIGSKRLAYKF